MKFAPHSDGSFVRNENEMSFYSYLVYLNDDFEGGETSFFTKPAATSKPFCPRKFSGPAERRCSVDCGIVERVSARVQTEQARLDHWLRLPARSSAAVCLGKLPKPSRLVQTACPRTRPERLANDEPVQRRQ